MRTPKLPAIRRRGRSVSIVGPTTMLAVGALAAWELRARIGAPGRWDSLSVQEWIRRVPSAAARELLAVFVEVAVTSDPAELSMGAFIAMVRHEGGLSSMLTTRGGAQDSLVVEGAGGLADKIATELRSRVLTDSPVTAIRREADGIVVQTPSHTIRADKIVITVPPPMLRSIDFDPPLPPERIALQQNMVMGSVYKAIAVYEEPFWRAQGDAEAILADAPGLAVFDTSPPDGPGHLCVLIGGRSARALDGLDEAARRKLVLQSVIDVAGSDRVLAPVGWHDKSWHLDPHAGGGYVALPSMNTRVGRYPLPSDPIDDTIYWAGAETASEHAGYIEGAIESGERVADQIDAAMAGRRGIAADGARA